MAVHPEIPVHAVIYSRKRICASLARGFDLRYDALISGARETSMSDETPPGGDDDTTRNVDPSRSQVLQSRADLSHNELVKQLRYQLEEQEESHGREVQNGNSAHLREIENMMQAHIDERSRSVAQAQAEKDERDTRSETLYEITKLGHGRAVKEARVKNFLLLVSMAANVALAGARMGISLPGVGEISTDGEVVTVESEDESEPEPEDEPEDEPEPSPEDD